MIFMCHMKAYDNMMAATLWHMIYHPRVTGQMKYIRVHARNLQSGALYPCKIPNVESDSSLVGRGPFVYSV